MLVVSEPCTNNNTKIHNNNTNNGTQLSGLAQVCLMFAEMKILLLRYIPTQIAGLSCICFSLDKILDLSL